MSGPWIHWFEMNSEAWAGSVILQKTKAGQPSSYYLAPVEFIEWRYPRENRWYRLPWPELREWVVANPDDAPIQEKLHFGKPTTFYVIKLDTLRLAFGDQLEEGPLVEELPSEGYHDGDGAGDAGGEDFAPDVVRRERDAEFRD